MMTQKGKVIVCSAPSGSGKSTIINRVITQGVPLSFSVSATSRQPRGSEVHGKEYYFLTPEEFRTEIEREAFLEYEEVYPGCFYGTLKSEVDNRLERGENVILDIDVVGALNIKRIYGEEAITIFIAPPSLEALRERLVSRGTDSDEVIAKRLDKAELELSYAPHFDQQIINDDLDEACDRVSEIITQFIGV